MIFKWLMTKTREDDIPVKDRTKNNTLTQNAIMIMRCPVQWSIRITSTACPVCGTPKRDLEREKSQKTPTDKNLQCWRSLLDCYQSIVDGFMPITHVQSVGDQCQWYMYMYMKIHRDRARTSPDIIMSWEFWVDISTFSKPDLWNQRDNI